MELALSLGGDTPKPIAFLTKNQQKIVEKDRINLGFFMGLGGASDLVKINGSGRSSHDHEQGGGDQEEKTSGSNIAPPPPPVQLDLLPFAPVQRNQQLPSHLPFPWLTANLLSGPGRDLEVNRRPLAAEEGEEGAALSSPNSTVSSLQMDFSMYRSGRGNKRDRPEGTSVINEVDKDHHHQISGASSYSRASDEDENMNGLNRKKLRLSKEQSAFLEESFKEHHTLNPKQKLALANQLNLRPRQVEVWFQNRRARTKLKQTEVDCEYLKRWCETLTEENRRLQKELQDLRALKNTSKPFYMQLPATTLTMCPSCERVASTTATANATSGTAAAAATTNNTPLALAKSRLFPFSTSHSKSQTQAQKDGS